MLNGYTRKATQIPRTIWLESLKHTEGLLKDSLSTYGSEKQGKLYPVPYFYKVISQAAVLDSATQP